MSMAIILVAFATIQFWLHQNETFEMSSVRFLFTGRSDEVLASLDKELSLAYMSVSLVFDGH